MMNTAAHYRTSLPVVVVIAIVQQILTGGCHLVIGPLLLASFASAETTTTTPSSIGARMDLSFRPNLSTKSFVNFIKRRQQQQTTQRYDSLELDLSSSEIHNDGIVEILQAVVGMLGTSFSNDNNRNNLTTTSLALICRMNRLDPAGVTALFNQFLPKNEKTEEEVAKEKRQKVRSSKRKKNNRGSKHEEEETAKTSNNNEEEEEKDTTADLKTELPTMKLQLLDLAWNSLHPPEYNKDNSHYKEMLSSLQRLVEDLDRCPETIRLDCCGLTAAACRSIGKGLRNRVRLSSNINNPTRKKSLSLHLSGNPDIGDAGLAALAAAIKSATASPSTKDDDNNKKDATSPDADDDVAIFDMLDLSGCNVGDDGVEALALALESRPGAVRQLDLSNNKISNRGATALADALHTTASSSSSGADDDGKAMYKLDLSNNDGIGDVGATSIAEAMKKGKLQNIALRSCSIYADGSEAFGSLINSLATTTRSTTTNSDDNEEVVVEIDLSGNPIGTLRKKKKQNAASAIKSKASATTASYMSFISKKIQSGLKDVGLADTPLGGLMASSTAESDDEEEERMSNGNEDPADVDPAKARCGAKALASAVVVMDEAHHSTTTVDPSSFDKDCKVHCILGVRRCFLDEGAADALAATVFQAQNRLGIKLTIDARLNPALEERFVDALHGDGDVATLVEDMSDRHMNELEVLRLSEERAAQRAAAMRRESRAWDDHHHNEEDDFFGGGDDFNEGYQDDDYDDEADDQW